MLELNQTSDSKHAFTAPSKRAPRLTVPEAPGTCSVPGTQLRPHDRNPKCPRGYCYRFSRTVLTSRTSPAYPQKNTHAHEPACVSKAWEAGHGCCGHPSPQSRPPQRRHSQAPHLGLTFWRNVIYCCLQFATSHGAGPREGHEGTRSQCRFGGERSPGGSSPSPGSPPGP